MTYGIVQVDPLFHKECEVATYVNLTKWEVQNLTWSQTHGYWVIGLSVAIGMGI